MSSKPTSLVGLLFLSPRTRDVIRDQLPKKTERAIFCPVSQLMSSSPKERNIPDFVSCTDT